jgi:8-hydroxy-5-deazaflavin:NADPH oxidoreductase
MRSLQSQKSHGEESRASVFRYPGFFRAFCSGTWILRSDPLMANSKLGESMNIGVVGSGKVGRALGAWAARCGYAVAFTSREELDAREAAQKAGQGAKATDLATLVEGASVILLTLPYKEILRALAPVRERLDGKTLVDVSNPITDDRKSLTLGHTTSGAEEIAKHFPLTSVVKAFNAVFAEVYELQNPQIAGHPISILYAGDNPLTKDVVRELIASMGFDAVDAGPLQNARCLEPLSLLNIQLGRVLGLGTRIGFSLLQEQ